MTWNEAERTRADPAPRRRGGMVVLGVVAVLASLIACGDDGTDGSSTTSAPPASAPSTAGPGSGDPVPAGTYDVGRVERTYEDTTRVTAAHGGRAELSSRTLPTLVLYPAEEAGDAATPLDGPWPLIVFSHGSTRAGVDYEAKLSWWASAGYVVAAPDFPLSSTGTPGGTAYGDYENQAGDVSFVIDSVLADDAAVPPFGALVDPDRVGLGGQSFGAMTTIGVVAAACCADPRIVAATEFAGMWLPFSTGEALAPRAVEVPMLYVHGDEDPTVSYAAGHDTWTRIGAPGGFLTLVGTGHDDGFFGGGEPPLDRLVSDTTLAFYDAHLKDDPAATDRLERLVADAGTDEARFEPTPA